MEITDRDLLSLSQNINDQYQLPRQYVASNFRGHFSQMRKDLDVSNYTSGNSKQGQKIINNLKNSEEFVEVTNDSGIMDDASIISYIFQELMKDDTFRSAKNLTLLLAAVEKMRKNPHIFDGAILMSAEKRQDELSEKLNLNPETTYKMRNKTMKEHTKVGGLPIVPLTDKELHAIHRSLTKTRKTYKRPISSQSIDIYKKNTHT